MKAANLKKMTCMILLLAGIAGIVPAQKAFLFNDIPALLAGINDDVRREIILSAEATRTSYNIYYEAELELEDWMINYDFQAVSDQNEKNMPSVFAVEEEEIPLEEWMVQPLLTQLIEVDREKELELENWMIGQDDRVE